MDSRALTINTFWCTDFGEVKIKYLVMFIGLQNRLFSYQHENIYYEYVTVSLGFGLQYNFLSRHDLHLEANSHRNS